MSPATRRIAAEPFMDSSIGKTCLGSIGPSTSPVPINPPPAVPSRRLPSKRLFGLNSAFVETPARELATRPEIAGAGDLAAQVSAA